MFNYDNSPAVLTILLFFCWTQAVETSSKVLFAINLAVVALGAPQHFKPPYYSFLFKSILAQDRNNLAFTFTVFKQTNLS